MSNLSYKWTAHGEEHGFELVRVPGTNGEPYLFGRGDNRRPINVREFYISTTPVTQALWLHVMGANPAKQSGIQCPVENVSWNHITEAGGFLDRINSSEILTTLNDHGQDGRATLRFRLPSETEWEYAARGGPNWKDGFIYSGSNDAKEVAWYGPQWGRRHDLGVVSGRQHGRFECCAGGRKALRWPGRGAKTARRLPSQLESSLHRLVAIRH